LATERLTTKYRRKSVSDKTYHSSEWNLESIASSLERLSRTMKKIEEDLAVLKGIKDGLDRITVIQPLMPTPMPTPMTPYPYPIGPMWNAPSIDPCYIESKTVSPHTVPVVPPTCDFGKAVVFPPEVTT
jgi:hypothetical protein